MFLARSFCFESGGIFCASFLTSSFSVIFRSKSFSLSYGFVVLKAPDWPTGRCAEVILPQFGLMCVGII